jgi:macrolide-specific efflux system membrane fusion protein
LTDTKHIDMNPMTSNPRLVRTLRWLVPAIALLLLAYCVRQFWFVSPAPPAFATAPVIRADIEETVLATGTIGAIKLVSVGAQVTGQVTALHVALGDTVRQGQRIAEIDALPQQNALRTAQAQVHSVEAQMRVRKAALVQAGLALKRQRELVAAKAGAPADLETADANLQSAQAEVE